MIRRAAKEDNSRVLSFLAQEGSLNTTFFAHIEKYGYEKDFQDIWIYNGEQNETLAVIMRHFNALYLYSRDSLLDYDVLSSFVSFIGADVISGKLEILSEIALSVEGMVLEPSRHMVLARPESLVPCGAVERGRVEDCQELSELIYSIPEFARFYSSRLEIERGIRRRMELGICRYFVLRQDGVIASQAYTTIESEAYATIGGVVTREEFRKQGMASLVVSCICEDILKDHKVPNLFYTNEEAGRVYERLGFEAVTDYAMLISHAYLLKS